MHLPDPQFPPLLTGHPVKAPASPTAHAVAGARAGEFGAGDIVWSRNTARFECAMVLEPEVPRARALEMLFVAMAAFGDALGTLAPPEVAVTFSWPNVLRVNGGRVGEVDLVLPPGVAADAVPPWMVVGIGVAMLGDLSDTEPGRDLDNTCLQEEGVGDVTRTELLESYSRHLLTWILDWTDDGFRQVHENWLGRAQDRQREIEVRLRGGQLHGGTTASGIFTGLDETGNLLLKTDAGIELLRLDEALDLERA
jgi:biotin-(acetyl-CoA carboxylase) ligase